MRATVMALAACVGAAAAGAQSGPVVSEQKSGVTALLQAVAPVDEKVVWVSGQSAAVLRTLDGGETWEVKQVTGAPRNLQFRDIHALSRDVAWVLSAGNGAASRIYKTVDGGATWAMQFTNADSAAFYDCLTFFDAKRGVAFSDATHGKTMILRTEDGGAHWNLLDAAVVPAPLEGEGGFSASGGCVVSAGNKHAWVATDKSRIFRSDDAGKTWSAFQTPLFRAAGTGMTAAAFRDPKHGIGVGGVSGQTRNTDTTSAAVAITDDGGKTWTLRHRPPAGSLFGVTWVPKAGKATAVAASMTALMVTRDAGMTWTALAPATYWSVGAVGRRAWGVGPGGRIVRLDF